MTLAMSSDGSGFDQARNINSSPCASGAFAMHGFFPTFQTSGFFERESMNDKQPEALRLTDALRMADILQYQLPSVDCLDQAADELRRLHAVNAELLEALRLVMACAGEITTAPDSLLEEALNYGDPETRKQAYAFLLCRAAIEKAEGK